MADQNDLASAFAAKLGVDKSQPSGTAAGTQNQQGSLASQFSEVLNRQPSKEEQEDAKYQQRIEAWMPEAKAQAEKQGYIGAIGQGIRNIPIVGPAIGAAGNALAAATGAGYEHLSPEENTFSGRYQNIKAGEEALNRAYKESHPITMTGTEIGGSLLLPAGAITKGVSSVVAPAAGATGSIAATRAALAPILGFGAEGAAFGATEAASQKMFGTAPEKEKPSIGESALIGGGLGVGLGAAAKGTQKVLENFGPEWLKTIGKFDENLANAAREDFRTGNVRMTPQEAIDRLNQGQPVTVADLYGPKWKQALEKAAAGRPETVRELQDQLTQRSKEGFERFSDFVDSMRGSVENPQELFQRAQEAGSAAKKAAYENALAPGRNSGAWKPEWDTWLKSPTVRQAIDMTEAEIKDAMALRGVDPVNFQSPFKVKMRMDPKTGDILPVINAADGRPQIESVLRNRVDNAYLDTLQRNLNKIADNRFNQAYVAQGASAQGAANARKEIVNTLREPTINGQRNPFHDPAYAEAHANTIAYRENGDAFSYGQDILRKVRNARDASQIELETRAMTPQERDLATHGLLTDMRQRVMKGDGSINTRKLDEFFSQGPVRQAMENILTPAKFNDLERYIKTESLMNNTMNEINRMGSGHTNSQQIRQILYGLMDYKLAGLRLIGIYANDFMGGRLARQIAEKFSSGNINDFNDVYRMLANNPRNMRTFASFIDSIASKAAQQGALVAGPNIPQGYEQKAMGGPVGRKAQRNKQIESASTSLIQAGTQQDQPMKDGGTPNPNYIPHDDPRRAQNLSSFMHGSHAKDEEDAPRRLYHATSSSFSQFDPKKAAQNSKHPASRLGHFLTETPEAADLFSRVPDRFSEGTGEYKPGANIMPVHASIKNPHIMHWKDFAAALAALNSMPDKKANKEVDAFRQQLIDAGHDGIFIKGGWKPGQFLGSPEFSSNNWVAFEPNQIKSATGNRGTFDPAHPNINKKRGGDVEYIPHDDKRRAKNLKDFHGKTPKEIKEGRWFHGTGKDFSQFREGDPIFVTQSPRFANRFAMEGLPSKDHWEIHGADNKPAVMPLHVRAENTFDFSNKRHVKALENHLTPEMKKDAYLRYQFDSLKNGDWQEIESKKIQNAIKALGHDSFYVDENGIKNLAVYSPLQLKSATGNQGTFDPAHPDINKKRGGDVEPLTQDVYHGTRGDFNKFHDDIYQSSMSRALGTHVAVDPAISSSDQFMKSPVDDKVLRGANVMPMKTMPLDKFYPVHQPYHEDMGDHANDDDSVRNEILHHGYTNDKEQFIKDVMQHRKYDRKTAEQAYRILTSGNWWGEGDGGRYKTIRSFVGNYHMQPSDPKDREKLIRNFRQHLRSQGYVGVKYINTGPIETANAKDKTSLIVFPDAAEPGQQYPLRGRFAKMDPARSHEPDLMAARGGEVRRPKRATGGRIPEIDKMFKAAKKIVDSQSKPILNAPDDIVVKALNVAKRRI